MSKLFSGRKRLMGLGVIGALVVALAVVATLGWVTQTASADPDGVVLAHVEPDGSDYDGNPYCPDTDWSGGKNAPVVNHWHDCNNITSQYHVIRTDGWADTFSDASWNIENASGANATVVAQGLCGDIAEVANRDAWVGTALCADDVDADGDTVVNDGCPKVASDDDADTVINDGCPAVGDAECDLSDGAGGAPDGDCADADDDLTLCDNGIDDDADTTLDDGCPIVATYADCDLGDGAGGGPDGDCADTGEAALCVDPESACDDSVDDDGDTFVNDGCPTVGGVTENMDDQQCVVIHSSTPGETRVTLTYNNGTGVVISNPVVKEWDSLVGSVILKCASADDCDLETVKAVGYDADGDTVVESGEKWSERLPKDADGDGDRDAEDEHLLDRQSTWQDHGVIFDEAKKRIKSPVPIEIIEVVHGEHQVLINSVSITTHQPTQGALVLAEIVSPRRCTFFTDATGSVDLGQTLPVQVTDKLGRVIVYVDTVCEEQAEIHFYAQYPNLPGSLRIGLHEWIGINWTTIELAKQPQIRWAGEEIVLAKRWALPDEYYPNAIDDDADTVADEDPVDGVDNDSDTLVDEDPINPCPLATIGGAVMTDTDADLLGLPDTVVTHHVNYVLKDPGLGALEGGYVDMNGDGVLDTLAFDGQSEAIGDIDDMCRSMALADSENQGQQDIEAKLMEDKYFCPPLSMALGHEQTANLNLAQALPGQIRYDATAGGWVCDYYDVDYPVVTGWPAELQYSTLVNKHAFLVWYLKIYQVKLTNVDGARADHNAGAWEFGEGEDTEGDSLNVSADTLLRATVKGWFFGGNNSSRGAVCVDIDGDGDGDPDTEEEAGVPYPLSQYEAGCPDPDDEIVDHGHWVLPDDLPALAGPDAIVTRPNWDVMSEADASKTTAIGPKSSLDSHDAVPRTWVPGGRKTVVPDGAITEADAIMPPLKIRASIAADDAGFLKEALKAVDVYPATNDYDESAIPDVPEIPAMVNNGGYDWNTWGMPPCPDADHDGVCDDVDRCAAVFDPTNSDVDGDTVGDACDDDSDGDTIPDDGDGSGVAGDALCIGGVTANCDDNCRLKSNDTQADADSDGVGTACDIDDAVAGGPALDLDSDGDAVIDPLDNCPAKSNAAQTDTDRDGYGDACDPSPALPYWAAPPVYYPFWSILNKFERDDPNEADPALVRRPWYIEFYTDNRGEGMFFANGDFNLSFDDCRPDALTGAPDCSPNDVVGQSTISVIGDYPYFRKHSAVESNPVIKTWEWGGFKTVTAEAIDATHTAIIAHLVDRDGFCVDSPSLHPVIGEEIEFILNTEVGSIIEGAYDGVIIDRSEAIVLAEDTSDDGLLDDLGLRRAVVQEDECQAWVLIEHPLGGELDVSIRFHDPEGIITRHWPPSELVVSLVQGWNDSCHVGPEGDLEEALDDAGILEDVLAVYRYDAETQAWEHYFPGRCEEEGLCTIESLGSYDQLLVLMGAPALWAQPITAIPTSVALVGASAEADVLAGWNSVCYAGADKATEEATSSIEGSFVIMYSLGSDQMWRRYVPARPEIPDTLTTLHRFDSVFLLVTTEGGTTWVFDP